MQRYKSRTRTTMDSTDDLPAGGIYVIAYLGRIMYVGKAEGGIAQRLQAHIDTLTPLGIWLRQVADWANIRVDALEAPDALPERWCKEAERALIAQFKPLLNTATGG